MIRHITKRGRGEGKEEGKEDSLKNQTIKRVRRSFFSMYKCVCIVLCYICAINTINITVTILCLCAAKTKKKKGEEDEKGRKTTKISAALFYGAFCSAVLRSVVLCSVVAIMLYSVLLYTSLSQPFPYPSYIFFSCDRTLAWWRQAVTVLTYLHGVKEAQVGKI